MADEKVFYSHNGVNVTNSRLVAGGETYAMSGVTSVKLHEQLPSRKGPIILVVLGALVVLGSLNGMNLGALVLGAIAVAIGVFWWIKQQGIFHVMLRTASGESKAYHSTNQEEIAAIVKAINDAIIHRG